MRKLTQIFRRITLGNQPQDTQPSSPEELRAEFAHRYHNFKLLVTANNKALEIMADMEKALEGQQPFGISFVRSRCTAVSVNVFRMIKHLDELAPGKYSQLYERFKLIQTRINRILAREKPADEGPLVVPLSSVNRSMVDQVGCKMANLAEIRNTMGLPIPVGFVITSRSYLEFIRHKELKVEIKRRIQAAESERIDDLFKLSSDIQRLIITAPVPEPVKEAIFEGYRAIEREAGQGVKVSLRSSGLGEDALGVTFAGQFRTILNLDTDSLIDAYKEIVASKYGLPAMTYRLNRGIPDEDVAMCVGCMAMVNAVSGGVMYSSNPLNIRDRSILINSVWGLPKAVVDGSVSPDSLVISRTDPLSVTEKHVAVKEREYKCYPEEGVCRLDLTGEKSAVQSISDEQALELASMAVTLERHYGLPQDIEWAIDANGSICILQCRPLQQFDSCTDVRPLQGECPSCAPVLIRGGITASPGIASGPVFVVKSDADKLKFPEGAVLVASQSLPAWAPLLSRAAAVVTEVGGVAGHLANVAREFGVPALFGVSDAIRFVNQGDVVTVDADGQAVYAGRVESLLRELTPKKNLMRGSPVHKILKAVAAQIVPLNLLDPDSPFFHPKKCETFHDLTRFIHEKSVREMFNFGKDHHFSERASKQLVTDRPLQWWIINLDDGFKEDDDEGTVHLDNIVSIPMLAIWDGATAFPWEGPPPVDARGFMSVLVQATSNPALDPAMSSPYAARNYFMISRNFCSLTSRFGFHFCTVEALVGDRAPENYVSFSFQGGAADFHRRAKRVGLAAYLLETYGFRVEIREDRAFARLEGMDENFMKSRLRILGYLLMHTRQIDMVMGSDSETARYRTKFLNDMEEILNRDW